MDQPVKSSGSQKRVEEAVEELGLDIQISRMPQSTRTRAGSSGRLRL